MSCYQCKYFSELKKPKVQTHHQGWDYTIYGYCFHKKGIQEDFHKGYAVFIPDGACKDFKRDKSKPEKIYGQMTIEDILSEYTTKAETNNTEG